MDIIIYYSPCGWWWIHHTEQQHHDVQNARGIKWCGLPRGQVMYNIVVVDVLISGAAWWKSGKIEDAGWLFFFSVCCCCCKTKEFFLLTFSDLLLLADGGGTTGRSRDEQRCGKGGRPTVPLVDDVVPRLSWLPLPLLPPAFNSRHRLNVSYSGDSVLLQNFWIK